MIGSISRTLSTIRTKLNANSTVIWSGRGYHVIQVIDASYVNLKSQEVFTRGRINYLLSDYCVYLANKKAQELRRITGQRRKERQLSYPRVYSKWEHQLYHSVDRKITSNTDSGR